MSWAYFGGVIILLLLIVLLLLGVFIVPRFVVTTLKDNFGKMPEEIDKTYYSIIKVGGISFFPLLCVDVALAIILLCTSELPNNNSFITGSMLLGGTLLYMVGLRYDLRGVSSLVRLIVLLIVPLPVVVLCPSFLTALLMYLAAVYMIEMMKLLDGMNGLASGTLTITLLLLLILDIMQGYWFPVLVILSALVVVVPFWLMKMFSKKWKKVIMGNAGAYTMGLVLVYAFFSSFSNNGGDLVFGDNFVVALSIIMLPALDTLRVIGSRARDSRSIIMPDRNQINFKLLRTGMPNGAIFPTYICLIVLFAVSAYLMLHWGVNDGLVAGIEVLLWVATELVMNYFIRSREKRHHLKQWDRVYGREAWDANGPYEQIEAKQLLFGTLGLSERFIDGDEQDFISDSMNLAERFGKRLFDIVVSALCLVVFSPLFLLCYILIKIDDGKDVLFSQERIGRYGRPFNIYKFRTMSVDAEQTGPQLSHAQGEDDPRLTKIGRFLRAHHLDKLPQLWNVLVGDMSLIGYRPERKYYIDQIMEHDPRYAFLYQIRPGVTSYATLYNGYTDTMEKMLRRLELDLYYLAHRSGWFDCKILFLTFASIVFGKKF